MSDFFVWMVGGGIGAAGLAAVCAVRGFVPGRTRAGRPGLAYLSLAFLEIAGYFAILALEWAGSPRFPIRVLTCASSLYGLPALWIYLRISAGAPPSRIVIHFLPSVAFMVSGLFAAQAQARPWLGSLSVEGVYALSLMGAQTVQLVCYGFACIRIWPLTPDNPQVTWMKRAACACMGGFAVFLLLSWVGFFHTWGAEEGWFAPALEPDLAGPLIVSLVVWTAGLCILWGKPPARADRIPEERYRHHPMTKAEAARIVDNLRALVGDAQDLDDARMNPRKLAQRLGIGYHRLSQAVNQETERTIPDFVNDHRIRRAQRLLSDKPETSILEVAFRSGFSSKSTFNARFKASTGLTPTEFRRQTEGKV